MKAASFVLEIQKGRDDMSWKYGPVHRGNKDDYCYRVNFRTEDDDEEHDLIMDTEKQAFDHLKDMPSSVTDRRVDRIARFQTPIIHVHIRSCDEDVSDKTCEFIGDDMEAVSRARDWANEWLAYEPYALTGYSLTIIDPRGKVLHEETVRKPKGDPVYTIY